MTRNKGIAFSKPTLDATFLVMALMNIVKYVQSNLFGDVVDLLKSDTPDAFESFLKSLGNEAKNAEQLRWISELKSLRNLRPWVDASYLLRVEGRLENAKLPLDTKHPFILPSRHSLTRLIVIQEHVEAGHAGHAGPSYTLMRTRQRFWIVHGISSVKRYLGDCGMYALCKATPVRQLMADLPACRVTPTNKPFKFCAADDLGPHIYR